LVGTSLLLHLHLEPQLAPRRRQPLVRRPRPHVDPADDGAPAAAAAVRREQRAPAEAEGRGAAPHLAPGAERVEEREGAAVVHLVK
jgi:hypothetical protein